MAVQQRARRRAGEQHARQCEREVSYLFYSGGKSFEFYLRPVRP